MNLIDPNKFIDLIRGHGIEYVSGVPCSGISSLFHELERNNNISYISAPNEAVALGINAGLWLSGKLSALFCQNSGIGHTINPLTSLNEPYRIPALLFVSMRGHPDYPDEPQHQIMGKESANFLRLAGVNVIGELTRDLDEMSVVLKQSTKGVSERISQAFTIPPRVFSSDNYEATKSTKKIGCDKNSYISYHKGKDISRRQAVEIFYDLFPEEITVSTMGLTSRELCSAAGKEKANHFLMAGSLGLASSIGLGVTLNNKQNKVFVLDGDGSLAMHMGNMAVIGSEAPKNLIHVLFDNSSHGSTGGQTTSSVNTDFAKVALANRYNNVFSCSGLEGISKSLFNAKRKEGPTFVHCKVSNIDNRPPAPRAPKDYEAHAESFKNYIISLSQN